jgi:hypothetical protein
VIGSSASGAAVGLVTLQAASISATPIKTQTCQQLRFIFCTLLLFRSVGPAMQVI